MRPGVSSVSHPGLQETTIPTPVPLPRHLKVAQAAAGDQHTLLLTRCGKVYAMGDNSRGQLGIAESTREASNPQPRQLRMLSEAFVVHIAAGKEHSAAVSDIGALWTWGAGDHGKTGHGDSQDRFLPCLVKSMQKEKVVCISAGRSHTVAKTEVSYGSCHCDTLCTSFASQ